MEKGDKLLNRDDLGRFDRRRIYILKMLFQIFIVYESYKRVLLKSAYFKALNIIWGFNCK